MKTQKSQLVKTCKITSTSRATIKSDIKLYYTLSSAKITWYREKNRHTDQQNRIDP